MLIASSSFPDAYCVCVGGGVPMWPVCTQGLSKAKAFSGVYLLRSPWHPAEFTEIILISREEAEAPGAQGVSRVAQAGHRWRSGVRLHHQSPCSCLERVITLGVARTTALTLLVHVAASWTRPDPRNPLPGGTLPRNISC